MWDYDDGDEPMVIIEQRSGSTVSFLWGALLGAGIALLLAPQSGEESRRQIATRARRVKDAAQERAEELSDTVVDRYETARQSVEERLDSARRTLEARRTQAAEALRAGREAAQNARADLERRIAQSKAAYDAASEAMREGGESPGATPEPEAEADERPARRRRNG